MKRAYWIAFYRSISDKEKLAVYAAQALPAIKAAGGTFLARGMPDSVQEAGENNRTVIVQFDSLEEALDAYNSVAYQKALTALGDGAVRDLRIIEAT